MTCGPNYLHFISLFLWTMPWFYVAYGGHWIGILIGLPFLVIFLKTDAIKETTGRMEEV
jgi:hypothetical protein